jgi:peptide chain release factor 1
VDGSPADWTGEAGGHRFQRVPPTERRGRVHTSTVTVAVHDDHRELRAVRVDERDLSISWFSGTGKGGQNRNKVQASCRLLHIPTGIEAKAECRTREASYRSALDVINDRVASYHADQERSRHVGSTRSQIGSGQRGDKIRTYRLQADEVVDHHQGWRKRWIDVERGAF